jgi:AraC-like DNA-binding protein
MNIQDIRFLTDADLTISSIQLAGERCYPANWHFEQKEDRLSHGVVFILEGSVVFQMTEGDIAAGKYDIVYLPRGCRYVTLGAPQGTYRFIFANFLLHDEDDALGQIPLKQVTKPANPAQYASLFHELASKWLFKGAVYKLKCKSLLMDILFHLIQDTIEEHQQLNNLTRIQSAVEYMEQHSDRAMSIPQLARMVSLSESHFRRLFHQIFGVAPQEYLNSIRINRAKDLIWSGEYTLSEIARRTGFTNIYYFSRAFRKATGVAPSAFGQ